MVSRIMKESMQREEDENDWGFAPSRTPFTERILKAEFPRKFAPPTIQAYRGTSDPNHFLYKYDWHMTGARASDEIKCRYFPVYLEGVALLWFTKLPVRSVDKFSDLTQKFKEQFRLYASKAKDIMSLSNLEQAPGESIKSFLSRFNIALAEVENAEPRMILTYLMRAIDKSSKFGIWLKMKEPNSLDKFYKKADEFIRLESLSTTSKVVAAQTNNNNVPSNKRESESQKRENEGGKSQGNEKKPRRFNPSDYTPLTDTPRNIFFATKDVVRYPKPPEMTRGAKRNGKFCQFHNQPGHDTDQCRQLKNVIEELLEQGKLQQYVKRSGVAPTSSTRDQQRPTHQSDSLNNTAVQDSEKLVINVVTGGPHPAGRSWDDC